MLKTEANLNPKIFSREIESRPTRDGYGEGLVSAGQYNSNVVVLCADLTESTRSEAFAKKFPERFFEVGVAEQNLAAVAAGFGISGKIPFISSYAIFSPGRNWEQIRTTVAYNDSNVKIAGAHSGISVGPDGATHQALEDVAIMRVIPNMKVIIPCDAVEAKKAVLASAKIWGPVYLRFGRNATPVLTTEETPFVPGKAEVFWESNGKKSKSRKPQVAILGCGPLLYKALIVAKELDEESIGSVVVNCHTIKPFDDNFVLSVAKRCGAIVSVEEHQIAGGLGSVVSELLSKRFPAPMEFVGVKDSFGESGEPEELLSKYSMSAEDIKSAVKKVLKRKKAE